MDEFPTFGFELVDAELVDAELVDGEHELEFNVSGKIVKLYITKLRPWHLSVGNNSLHDLLLMKYG